MKIKSVIITFILAGSAVMGFAQKGELSSAKLNYDQYVKLKDANSATLGIPVLKNAKTSIDKVVEHIKTTGDATAWTYKALIYSELAFLDSVSATSKALATEAASALSKAKELDKAGENKANWGQVVLTLGNYQLNQGVESYKSKNFDAAYNLFNEGLNYSPSDTTLLYYSGLSAINLKNYKNAIAKYEALSKTNFSLNSQIFLDLSKLYTAEKDTASAIRVASEGAKKYPLNPELATQEIELSLLTGKQKEVIATITEQVQKNPTNKLYPFYLGIAYTSINDLQKAEDAYKNAIAIDPGYPDATLNLGILILNKGIELNNKAVKLPLSKQKEYDLISKQSVVELDRALPYLQKSLELNPKSISALESLKTYYIIKKNQAKVEEITQKLKAL